MAVSIELIDILHAYGQGESRVVALQELNLKVDPGRFVALMGPSGCGKTTLLNLIGGMDRPVSGQIRVNGEAVHEYPEKRLTEYRRDRVGFIFQFFNLLPTLTVLENVETPLLLAGRDGADAVHRARGLLEEVGLDSRRNHYPHQLSGGEMQRVAIARALVHRPEIVLADEPTGNLDSENGEKILRLLAGLCRREEVTVVMATHSREAASHADEILRLRDGQLDP